VDGPAHGTGAGDLRLGDVDHHRVHHCLLS
jgi:hypothetical protein